MDGGEGHRTPAPRRLGRLGRWFHPPARLLPRAPARTLTLAAAAAAAAAAGPEAARNAEAGERVGERL